MHLETFEFLEVVRKHFDQAIELLSANPKGVREMVKAKGLFSFYTEGHSKSCGTEGHSKSCDVRKVQPLRQKLDILAVWVTGQRLDQGVTHTALAQRQTDEVFSTEKRQLVKFNPLAHWTSADIWQYIRTYQVPYNPLHDRGFVSIGCQTCTRATGPYKHALAERWWREQA